MSKATHTGTCQICGATQKLPGGRLSKHGYTVEHGFFDGVCGGAHGLPFEQSTDLIEKVVASVAAQREQVLADAEALKTETSYVWVNVYVHGKYKLVRVAREDLVLNYFGEGNRWVRATYHADGARRATEVGRSGDTLDEKILQENQVHAGRLQKRAAAMATYIEWQQERVAAWTPGQLVAL